MPTAPTIPGAPAIPGKLTVNSQPHMTILLKVLLIALATFLFVICFGISAPFLHSIGLLDDLAGHGLANIAYLLYAGILGAVVGLVLSTYIMFKQPARTKLFFSILTATTVAITSTAFASVNLFGVKW